MGNPYFEPTIMVYDAGNCGTVGYPAQLQIAASQVLCNPANMKSQIKIVVATECSVWLPCGVTIFQLYSWKETLKSKPGLFTHCQ